MSKGFVPIGGATPGKEPLENAQGTKVMSAAQAAKLFHPTSGPTPASAPSAPASAGEPKITVEREGDRVTKIKIQCCCGQVIELACTY